MFASTTAKRPAPVVDRFGRRLSYVRVSVTDLCNLACTYCNPVQGCAATHADKLSWDDLDFLVDVCVNELGVEAIRITGGEPTIRPGLVEWIAGLRRHEALKDVSLTTNAIRLAQMAEPLAAAGVDRVNISLDSFDADRYARMTRGGSLRRCLDGIEAARSSFGRVKLNAVVMRGENLCELPDFAAFSHEKNIEVRFIELMPLFDQKEFFHEQFVGVEEMRTLLSERGFSLVSDERNASGYGPATTFRVEGSRARLGFISQMSDTKCLSCNKLRLTSDGALKACLLAPEEEPLGDSIAARDRVAIARAMRRQFLERAERYDFERAVSGSLGRGMQAVGG